MNKDYDEMNEYRRKHFDVEVSFCTHPTVPGEVRLSVTQNGTQWHSLILSPEERLHVIRELINFKG